MITPIKLLLIGAAIFILYKLITKDKSKKNEKSAVKEAKARERKIASGELIKDPICGTYVDSEDSISVKDGNKTYRFCSYECRQKFLDGLEDDETPALGEKDEA